MSIKPEKNVEVYAYFSMPKNRKEEILVFELWGKEKATVGTNAEKFLLLL